MPRVIERLNENSNRSYPFIEDSDMTAVSISNTIQLPANLIIDMFFVCYNHGYDSLVLKSIEIDGGGVTLTANFEYGLSSIAVPVSAAAAVPYQGEVIATDFYGNTTTLLRPVFGEGVAEMCAAYPGETFVVNDIPIEPAKTAIQNKHRVTGITAGGMPGNDRLTGVIYIEDGYNIRTHISTQTNSLRINAAIGEGLGIPCVNLFPSPTNCDQLVYFINGLHPNWYGEFRLVGGPGITIEPDPANHKLIIHTSVDHCRPKCKDPEEV